MTWSEVSAIVFVLAVFAHEALVASPGLNQGAVHAEVFLGQPPLLVCLLEHSVKERHHRIVLNEPLSVPGEHCGHPDRVVR